MNRPDQLPVTFTGIIASEPGGPDVLQAVQRPLPPLAGHEVLIQVAAAGVNRPDIMQRKGLYPPPPGASDILGLEVSGHIIALGDDVKGWRKGDAVCALLTGGGYADYAVARAETLLPAPKGLSLEQAAGLPETVFTVWANVFDAGRLQPGETLLVHGVNSGIGTTAIQMAKAHGCRVIATARGVDKCAQTQEIGADLAIDVSTCGFVDAVREAGGADVILDMIGGANVQQGIDCMNRHGRMVFIAFLAGSKVELDLRKVLFNHLTITGSTLRSRDWVEKARLRDGIRKTVWPWIEAKKFAPVIEREFDLCDAAAAHAHLEAGGHLGKILLRP